LEEGLGFVLGGFSNRQRKGRACCQGAEFGVMDSVGWLGYSWIALQSNIARDMDYNLKLLPQSILFFLS
jgi:hypothetical protein